MTEPDPAAIEFRVLGTIEALRDGGPLPVGGRRQRALLALLLLEPGRPVDVDRLAEQLWQGEPPPGAATTLRSYVSRLRRVLGEEDLITGGPAGYSLKVPSERIDAARFERLTREGQEALARGAVRRAAQRLGEALGLWRGRPFAELGDDGALREEAERLEELRRLALEDRIEADLALGKAPELVEELETLVKEHPYRERLWGQLMVALYRANRQADALATYQRARRILDEELGLEPGEDLRDLERAVLRREIPPVRLPEERHNLPAPVTTFIGRETELEGIDGLLREARLVTLTGIGGVGKTRLALEAARRALPDFPDGVFFADLAPLTDPQLVPGHLARALDVRDRAGVPIVDLLVARLRDAEVLVVLDNCEHLHEASADLAQQLLLNCPRLRMLATSRRSMGVPGEVDSPVAPLSLPPADGESGEVGSSEAVRLFLERARMVRPDLSEESEALATVARICRDLDGLPLAIELAAARAKALSVADIAARLTDRLRFLVSWRRLTAARYRTLREAMDWSYDLLSEEEQSLISRLSVFAGGFTLEAAASVCLDGDEELALELVERLVDGSLISAQERDGEMRYRLLETVRQYAAERLEARGETAETERRHADHFLAFAERMWWSIQHDFQAWSKTMEREHDNLRAALRWSRDSGDPERLLRLTKAVWWLWWVRGDLSEGREWLDVALERGAALDPGLRAPALEGAAGLAWAHGDPVRASELAERALSLFEGLGDRRGELACLTVLGHVARDRGDFPAAESLFERSRQAAEQLGDEFASGAFVALAMHNLGSVALDQGDLELAAGRFETALSMYRAGGEPYGVALSELYLGFVAIEAGDVDDGAGHVRRALPVFREMGFLQYATQCLDGAAAVLHARGAAREAVRLLGAAVALREGMGNPPGGMAARFRERQLGSLRAELGEAAFAAAWEEGLALSEREALDGAQRAVTG